MAGVYGDFFGFRNAVATAGQFVSVLSHDHATRHVHQVTITVIHQHTIVFLVVFAITGVEKA